MTGGQDRSDPGNSLGGQERGDRGVQLGYPFSAIVGQDQLRLALVLCAVRPEIGGVLIRGEKGTAKSTAVRGLAQVLARVDAEARLVELPIGATEDRVVGSLDLQRVMRDGEQAFSPGLLARARRRAVRRRGQPPARPSGGRAA